MKFDAVLSVIGRGNLSQTCGDEGQIVIPSDSTNSLTFVLASGTEYDPKKGTAQHKYSFRGVDPYPAVEETVSKLRNKCYSNVLARHAKDFGSLFSRFTLDLPDPNNSASVDTAKLLAGYTRAKGDPCVEGLVIDHGKTCSFFRPVRAASRLICKGNGHRT